MGCGGRLLALCSSATLLWIPTLHGQAFDSRIKPFLSANCYACHNDKVNAGSLNLQAYSDEAYARRKPEIWDKVREKLATGKMPPAGLPASAKAEVAAINESSHGVL